MDNDITVLGLDVHKETIVAAVLPAGGKVVRDLGVMPNTAEAVRKLIRRLRGSGKLVAVYEAGPCGYTTQRQIACLGVACVVVAAALIPIRPGDRVKTDRRDAAKLARLYRAGELTEVRVPTVAEEAARDLVRAREDVVANRLRARHRLSKFLLRQGRIWRDGGAWTGKHGAWLNAQRFEEPLQQQAFDAARRGVAETDAHLAMLSQQVTDAAQEAPWSAVVSALRSLKGVDTLAAMTLAVEVRDFRRFPTGPSFMAYTGLVSREDSSGSRIRRMGITKTGNAHVRRVLVEAAWHYRHARYHVGAALAARRAAVSPAIAQIAQRAQDRLHRKFGRLVSRGKPSQVAVVATARELAGFAWAMARAATVEAAT
jgi:transposase